LFAALAEKERALPAITESAPRSATLGALRARNTFAKAEGYRIVANFTEHESGKGADALDRRPKLAAAIKAAKKAGGPVIVSRWPSSNSTTVCFGPISN
jgi:hypothetical protein